MEEILDPDIYDNKTCRVGKFFYFAPRLTLASTGSWGSLRSVSRPGRRSTLSSGHTNQLNQYRFLLELYYLGNMIFHSFTLNASK